MTLSDQRVDAVVIGGGFYGTTIAIYLIKKRGFRQVVVIDKEAALLTRASYNNQARVHNGYHYPRSFTTAFRSRINLPNFVRDWPQAVRKDFTKLYAIARRNSKVTAKQFERFCQQIGATFQPANTKLRNLFEPKLIDNVFLVEEYAFDTTRLAQWADQELKALNIEIHLKTRVTAILQTHQDNLSLTLRRENSTEDKINCRYIFNCTYSGLNQFSGNFPGTRADLKHEIAEIALVKFPKVIENVGITVMDGPFFSAMPFPARNLHTLSHVRYTPHLGWEDQRNLDPYQRIELYSRDTRVDRMIRDASRYLPIMSEAKYIDSLFEVKTVLVKNEGDDGRPILFEKHPELSGCYSILGGKIDNIYDILEKLDSENLKAR